MSTRPQVEAAIAAIEDNGNNTAVEVRDVLTKLLNYTENDPNQGSSVEFFHFFNNGNFIEDRRGARLWYSCKGIQSDVELSGTANLTFRLMILEQSVNNPSFEVEPQFYEILRKIVPTNRVLSFSVPMKHPQVNLPVNATLLLSLKTPGVLALTILNKEGVIPECEVFTSLQLHAPEFFN